MSRKRATLRTRHDAPAVVARAVRPDNTDAMETTVAEGAPGERPGADGSAGGHVVARIERPTTGGLRSTVDDYVVNLRVAERVAATARGEPATAVDDGDDATADGTTASPGTNDSDITTDDTHDT